MSQKVTNTDDGRASIDGHEECRGEIRALRDLVRNGNVALDSWKAEEAFWAEREKTYRAALSLVIAHIEGNNPENAHRVAEEALK